MGEFERHILCAGNARVETYRDPAETGPRPPPPARPVAWLERAVTRLEPTGAWLPTPQNFVPYVRNERIEKRVTVRKPHRRIPPTRKRQRKTVTVMSFRFASRGLCAGHRRATTSATTPDVPLSRAVPQSARCRLLAAAGPAPPDVIGRSAPVPLCLVRRLLGSWAPPPPAPPPDPPPPNPPPMPRVAAAGSMASGCPRGGGSSRAASLMSASVEEHSSSPRAQRMSTDRGTHGALRGSASSSAP